MKRIYSLLMALWMLCLCAFPACAEGFVYTNPETGVSFILPAEWYESSLNEEKGSISTKFVSDQTDDVITYSRLDAWSNLTDTEKKRSPRSSFNNSALSLEELVNLIENEAGQNSLNIVRSQSVIINNISYFKIDYSYTQVDASTTISQLMVIDNGYIHTFQCMLNDAGELPPAFVELMNSVTFPHKLVGNQIYETTEQQAANANSIHPLLSILISLLITATIYTAPVFIFRRLIWRKPMSNKKAKIIVIVHAIVAFIIMNLVLYYLDGEPATGISLFLWSYINYQLLTEGNWVLDVKTYTPGSADDEYPEQIDFPIPITFCRKCGTKLNENSDCCQKCGCEIIQPSKE